MKVAPRGLKTQRHFEFVSEDENESEEEDLLGFETVEIDSTNWQIARTIFSTMTVTGQVALDKQQKSSLLLLEVSKMDISKLDMYRGDAASDEYMASPEAQKKVKENDPDEDFGESESDSDDEDEADIGKTQEGGLIQALLNIQL